MSNQNTITLEGRAVADGETRGRVGKFRLAVNSWRKDPNARPDSKYPNLTNWFTVVGFGERAGECADVRKGAFLRVTGSCEIVEFDDRHNPGQRRTAVEVHVGKGGSVEPIDRQQQQRGSDGPPAPSGHRVPASGGAGPLPKAPEFFDDDDGSVPF